MTLYSALKIAATVLALFFLLYLITFATAYPSRQLITAICFETGFILMILLFRFLSSKRKSQKAKSIVVEEIINGFKPIRVGRKVVLATVLAIALPLIMFVVLDFSALIAAIYGADSYAKAAYRLVPTYMVYEGAHPALSLELYSGSLIEAKKFEEAHKYTKMLFSIREEIYGKSHWMYGGMVANLANIYYKEGKYKKAEQTYRDSIALCQADQGYQKLGSAITRLGNCLREQGRYEEALVAYEEALKMRKQEFGPDSMRVAETTRELALLMTFLHRKESSDRLFEKVGKIIRLHSKEEKTDTAGIVVTAVLSIVLSFFLFGKNGYLTSLIVNRLEKKIREAGKNSDPADVEKLKQLLEYREDHVKLKKWKEEGLLGLTLGTASLGMIENL